MTGWSKILLAKGRITKNSIIRYHDSKFKAVFIIATSALFMVGLYALFYDGLAYLHNLPFMVGTFLLYRLVYFLMMLAFFMLIVSGIITSFSTAYSGEETGLLFSLPFSSKTIYLQKLAESTVFSSWAFIFIGLPFLISFGVVNRVPWYFYPLTALSSLPFLLLCSLLGCLVALLITYLFSHKKWKAYLAGLVIISIPLAYLGYKFFSLPDWESDSLYGMLQQVLGHFRLSQHPYLPNYWFSRVFLGLAKGDFTSTENFLNLSLLLGASLFLFFLVTHLLAPRWYFSAWSNAQGGRRVKKYPEGSGVIGKVERMLGFLPSYMRLLFMKDAKNFLRDPKQWSQFLIFFGLIGMYLLNVRTFAVGSLTAAWRFMTAFLNLAAMGLVLSSLTTRFMFPLFSLEGRRMWLLGLAPLDMKKVLLEKFYFTFLLSLAITEGLISVSIWKLKLPTVICWVFWGTVFLFSFALSGMAVGLGAVFPNFSSDNPTKIVSGFGGTLCFMLGMIYLTAVTASLAAPFYLYMVEGIFSAKGTIAALCFALVLSFLAGYLPLRSGIKSLRNLEI